MHALAHGTTIRVRASALGHVVAIVVAIVLSASSANAQDPFLLDGRPAGRIVISARATFASSVPLSTPMARITAGILADLDAKGRRDLARCVLDADRRGPWRRGKPIAYIHLLGESTHRTLEVLPGDRWYWLHTPGDFNTVGTLSRERFDALTAGGPKFRAAMRPPESTPQRLVIEHPYVPGAVTMDRKTMRHRLYHGMRVLNQPSDRRLERERMHVRVPAGYDPRSPAGLVVWASPTRSGEIPALFDSALDDIGLFAVGVDNAGNERDVPDKFQLMFDAVETVSRRYHIDPRRVYIVGMSGGGKVASILTNCFPDVFRGAMPIVGLASHHELSAEWGEHRQAYYSRPQGRVMQLATSRPLAVVGGPNDFNYAEMKARCGLLRREGFSLVEFFEDTTMGHELPSAGIFRRALEFVDGPWKIRRQMEINVATRAFRDYLEQHPDDPAPRSDADRMALNGILQAGPFTGAAWRAWELLAPSMRGNHR